MPAPGGRGSRMARQDAGLPGLMVSSHAQAGVVRDVKSGRERLWQLEPGQIDEARRTLELIGRQWELALGKLKAFVESE